MSIRQQIIDKITQELSPSYLLVENESHMHSVPANSETHFRVIVVSSEFDHLSRVMRQRKIYQLLKEELAGPVHALAQWCFSPSEWQKQQEAEAQALQSPKCNSKK